MSFDVRAELQPFEMMVKCMRCEGRAAGVTG